MIAVNYNIDIEFRVKNNGVVTKICGGGEVG